MLKTILFLVLFLLGFRGTARADTVYLEEGGKLSGQVVHGQDKTKVSWPYGSITLEGKAAPRPGAKALAPAPNPQALTHGRFSLRYELAERGNLIRPLSVAIKVRNETCYLKGKSRRLEEHEAMHAFINKTEGERLQKDILSFQAARGEGLKKAEKAFLSEFDLGMKRVEDLHRDWDQNHKTR